MFRSVKTDPSLMEHRDMPHLLAVVVSVGNRQTLLISSHVCPISFEFSYSSSRLVALLATNVGEE